MMVRRAAGGAAKRLLLVWIAAMLVIMLGLVIFQNHERLPLWKWRLEVARSLP